MISYKCFALISIFVAGTLPSSWIWDLVCVCLCVCVCVCVCARVIIPCTYLGGQDSVAVNAFAS